MDNQRLILLVVFFFSAFMLWEAWQKHEHPGLSTTATAASAVTASSAAVPTLSSIPATTGGVPATAAATGNAPEAVVKTDLFIANISAQGGDLIRLELTRHQATNQPDKNFVLFDSGEKHIYLGQSGLIGEGLPNHKSVWQLVPGTYELKDGTVWQQDDDHYEFRFAHQPEVEITNLQMMVHGMKRPVKVRRIR